MRKLTTNQTAALAGPWILRATGSSCGNPRASNSSGAERGSLLTISHRTSTSAVAVLLLPAASVAVSVYVVVLVGLTLTQRSKAGHTAFDCGSSVTLFAFETL